MIPINKNQNPLHQCVQFCESNITNGAAKIANNSYQFQREKWHTLVCAEEKERTSKML